MSEVQWGRPIEVNGVRPAWLRDDEVIRGRDTFSPRLIWKWKAIEVSWGDAACIELPADHYAYRAIEAGLEPWGGRDEAPADWDGSPVLTHNGIFTLGGRWTHIGSEYDIIGYRKRMPPPADRHAVADPDTVTIKRMTTDEARDLWFGDDFEQPKWIVEKFISKLFGMGLITETPLERFARDTGTEVNDTNRAAVEAALAWKEKPRVAQPDYARLGLDDPEGRN